MDNKRKIAILIYLHVRKETSKLEEQEIAAWRKESPGNEKLYLKLTDMEWVINYIREDKEDAEWFKKMTKLSRRYFDGVRHVGEPGFIPPKDESPPVYKKTLQELHEEDLAKWPHSKLEYWIHEIELVEDEEPIKKATVREDFERLLGWGGLLNTARDRRMAALLFLHVRKETSKREEKEIFDWRSESSQNESLYLQLTDMEYVVGHIKYFKEATYRSWDKYAARTPGLAGKKLAGQPGFIPDPDDPESGKTLEDEHEEAIVSKTRFTRLEYWIHELEDFDKRTNPPIRTIRKKKSSGREIILPVKFINKENI